MEAFPILLDENGKRIIVDPQRHALLGEITVDSYQENP
jgi:hypothetical protein